MAAKTYADRAKSIMQKYKKRLGDNFDKGDSLALEAMNQELSALQMEQEEERERLGVSDQRMMKMPMAQNGLDLFGLGLNAAKTFRGMRDGINKVPIDNIKPPSLQQMKAGMSDQPYKSRVPWMGAAAGVVGNLLMNQQIDLPEYNPIEYNPTKLNANLVDYSRGREQIMSERDQANAMIEGSAKGLGSQNALMENILAGRTGTQRVAGQQFNQSIENEGNINANILNETGRFNAAQNAEAARINMQNDLYSNQINRENLMINTDRKDSKIQGILDSVTGYGKDLLAANQYDTMLGMMTPENYKAYASKDSKARKFFGISPDMGMKLSKTDRMEKGGSLMLFGDDEYGKLMSRVKKKK